MLFFTDNSCSELKPAYASYTKSLMMNDANYQKLSATLQKMVLKMCTDGTWQENNFDNSKGSWDATRAKKYRVQLYEPYNEPEAAASALGINAHTNLNNPTGICATGGDVLYVFVGADPKEGSTLEIDAIVNNSSKGKRTKLKKGMNVIPVIGKDLTYFIIYTADTKKEHVLADFDSIPIHIEGGYVNGYWDKSRHNDDDWVDITRNFAKHRYMYVKGEREAFFMELEYMIKDNCCPDSISDAIGWWDNMVKWQHEIMGLEDYYPSRFNNRLCAVSLTDGYQAAGAYETFHVRTILTNILPFRNVMKNSDNAWGPAHEIGHMNQGAINIVSCTEESNNLFSNMVVHRIGKTTTRGNGLSVCREDFSNRTPFPLRGSDIIAKSRMFFQLYLYFHAAGKDTTFWPRVFEALRKNPLDKGPKDRNWTSLTQAKDDQLRFAEVCCEVAQMDLSEFFEVWGMFEPMTDAGVGDYENFIVNLTKEEAEASRARMQRYEKKGGHLIFIEDRIKPSPRTDGVEGNRLDFNEEFVIGKMGSTGQWNDYIDESVKAQGYYFSRKQNVISIITDKDAKGALGFKLYNAETGELLDFNNEYKLTVPVAHSNSPLRVVVTQADGTDQELPNAAESDNEEMLIETLEGLLTTVNNFFLTRSTKTGKEIGYFHDGALTDIKIFYNEAKSAVDNKDTSKHSYKEWIALLENETERLRKDPTARVYLKELDVYTLANFDKKTNYLCYDRYGLTTNSKSVVPNTAQEKLWMFESTGVAHHYYIKNKNGLYINDITSIGTSCSGTSKDEALVFKANYLDNATVYFTTADGKTYLTMNPGGDYDIIGSSSLINASTWVIRTVEFNNTAIEEVEIENEEDGTIYDLTGRKVDFPGKGIYIIDGKKVIIR